MSNKKNLFELVLRTISTELDYQKVMSENIEGYTPRLISHNMELVWALLDNTPFADIFNDEDWKIVSEYLDELTERFDGNLNNMSIHDIRCAGFQIANIVLKNHYLEKFSYNHSVEAFELISE